MYIHFVCKQMTDFKIAMTMKGFSALSKAPALIETH